MIQLFLNPSLSVSFSSPSSFNIYIYIIGNSISDAASNIIQEDPSEDVLNKVYELVENLEAALICSLECGEEPSVILVSYYLLYRYTNNKFWVRGRRRREKKKEGRKKYFNLIFSNYFSQQGNNVLVGASLNSLEDLREITLGDLTFTLPNNIQELQESLGGEGACVQVGYSLISTNEDEGYFYFFTLFFFYFFLLCYDALFQLINNYYSGRCSNCIFVIL